MITHKRSNLLKYKPTLENRFRLPGTSITMYLPSNVKLGKQVVWNTDYSVTEWQADGRHFTLTILTDRQVELKIRQKNALGKLTRTIRHKPITEQKWLDLCQELPKKRG